MILSEANPFPWFCAAARVAESGLAPAVPTSEAETAAYESLGGVVAAAEEAIGAALGLEDAETRALRDYVQDRFATSANKRRQVRHPLPDASRHAPRHLVCVSVAQLFLARTYRRTSWPGPGN